MPEHLGSIILFLCVGYLLVILELVVPGGILGILGILSIVYGCWLAFGLSLGWGIGSIGLSLVVFIGAVWFFLRSRAREGLMLTYDGAKDWKAARTELAELLGAEGISATPLRPAGTMLVGDQRIDVVTDGEFLPKGAAVQVVEVEGTRVVVEAVASIAGVVETRPSATPTEAPG